MAINSLARLEQYYAFSDTTLEPLESASNMQNLLGFQELAEHYGLDDASHQVNINGKPIEYLHLRQPNPTNTSVDVFFAPMGNGALSQNIAMRMLRYYAASDSAHVFMFAGPAHLSNKNNLLSHAERKRVAAGDLTDLIRPALHILSNAKDLVETPRFSMLGYSLGASMAQAATIAAPAYEIDVHRGVWAEPATTKKRSLLQLGRDFQRSGAELADYIKAANSLSLNEATELARDDFGFLAGMFRPSSIAVAKALRADDYLEKTDQAAAGNSGLSVVTIVGTESNISRDVIPELLRHHTEHTPYTVGRLRHMILNGMHHAGADDIDLHAAMMLEGKGWGHMKPDGTLWR